MTPKDKENKFLDQNHTNWLSRIKKEVIKDMVFTIKEIIITNNKTNKNLKDIVGADLSLSEYTELGIDDLNYVLEEHFSKKRNLKKEKL